MSLLSDEKQALRAGYRALRRARPPREHFELSRLLAERILSDPLFRLPVLLAYYPVRGEPDLRAVLERALACGKTVAFPLCGEKRSMTFRRIGSLGELRPGAYGIPEPSPDAPLLVPGPDSLSLLPGLSFDRRGVRLGNGGGYYDRFLPGFPGVAVGVCFRQDLSAQPLPCGNHDCRVNFVLTERERFICAPSRSLV